VPQGARLEDRFAVGDYVRTRILRIEEEEKKVGLSMRGITQPTPNEVSELKAEAAAKRQQLEDEAAKGEKVERKKKSDKDADVPASEES